MTLQDLPFLVLYRILALSDSLSDLGAMGGTCRPLYSVLDNHKAILIYQVLFTKLGLVLSDALALSEIEPLDENSPSYHQQVQDFVCIYKKYLAGENRPFPKDLSLDYVLGLAKYYRSMSYLTELYITSRLKIFENEVEISHTSTAMLVAPSRTEFLRVIRAFYRIQIATNAYGKCSLRYRRRFDKFDVECINYYLVGLWEPWEMQQIFCAEDMLDRIQLSLTQIADRALREEGMSRQVYYNLEKLRDFMVQKLTHNVAWPQALEWVSSLKREPHQVRSTFQFYSRDWFNDRNHDYRMKKFPQGKYSFPASIIFDGDVVGLVPFAWMDAFSGQYTQDFFGMKAGMERRDLILRKSGKQMYPLWCRLGFVMWDASRIASLKMDPTLSAFAKGWVKRASSA